MSELRDATIHSVRPDTPHLTRLELDVDADVRAAHTRPGQVLVVHPKPDDKLYLAIASPVGAERFEILLGSGARQRIAPAPGDGIKISPPSGGGFPFERADGKNVFLFAVGSALAPIRSLIAHFRASRSQYGRIVLYVGAHTEADFPFADEFESWRRDRIDVVKSISKPWVQERFKADAPSVEDAVAYVCGMKEMMNDVTQTLTDAGMPADLVGRNW